MSGTDRVARRMVYSSRQQALLICFECLEAPGELAVHRHLDTWQAHGEGQDSVSGPLDPPAWL